jgi:hypothetical protein
MTNSSFLKKLFLALSVVLLVSCDKDFNELGSDIIDDDIHHDMIGQTIDVVAYNASMGAVQSNNLPINQLGVFNSNVFGKTIAHFVTQLEFPANAANPTIFEPKVDSVYLYVPYYSKKISTSGSSSTYKLDSVYGSTEQTMSLKVYRNGYFLRDSDPNAPSGVQRYYSNERAMVDALKVGLPLNDDNINNNEQNTNFKISAKEIERKAIVKPGEAEKVIERMAPGIFVNLNKDIIQSQIVKAGSGNLLNNNVFKNYFRGLYFNIEQKGNDAVMVVPQFSKGVVIIKYTDNEVGLNGEKTDKLIKKTITLNLAGNTINFYDNTYGETFENALATANQTTGDSRLYVKGGSGSMAIINIDAAAIKSLAEKNDAVNGGVLVNEANLSFYIDKEAMKGTEPMRVYLYDIKNKTPLFDYYRDASSNKSDKKFDKVVHGGLLEFDNSGDKRGARYKIRLTNHLNNIIKNDSLNVPLGLVITEDINNVKNAGIKTPFTAGLYEVDRVPVSSVIQPFGTVLFGNNLPATDKNYDKRLKLEIFYTKAK